MHGSTPVAPVESPKSLQIGMLCCLQGANGRRLPSHPAHIPHGNPPDVETTSRPRICHRGRLGSLALVVLIAPSEPDPGLVASLRRPIEPLIHAPEGIQAPRIGGVRVVDDTVLEREGAHSLSLP